MRPVSRPSWKICICLNFLSARTPGWRVWRTLLFDMRSKAFAGAPSYHCASEVFVFIMRKSCVSTQAQDASIGSKFYLSTVRQYAELGILDHVHPYQWFQVQVRLSVHMLSRNTVVCYPTTCFCTVIVCCAICLWSPSSLFAAISNEVPEIIKATWCSLICLLGSPTR